MKKNTPSTPAVPPRALHTLMFLGVAEAALAVYQWLELVSLRRGGQTVCAVSETVNCDTVWNSPFASRVHELTGMPVAALGLVWGLVAFALPAAVFLRAHKGRPVGALVTAIKLVAVAGALAVIPLAIGSFSAGALCLTCLGTYALTLGYAAAAFLMVPKHAVAAGEPVGPALAWAGGFTLLAFLLLLWPGLNTPKAGEGGLPSSGSGAQAATGGPMQTAAPGQQSKMANPPSAEEYIAQMPASMQQAVSDSFHAWESAKAIPAPGEPRILYGTKDAPTKILEFTDIRCGHCGTLIRVLRELKRVVPDGLMSIEPRHYPLDSECNPQMKFSDGSGVRCLGAKALICLEQSPDYWRVQDTLFGEQATLTKDRIYQVASSGTMGRDALERCVESDATQQKLLEDINYATQYNLQGTPLVVVNGREGTSVPPFLYTMAMTKSDPSHPAWKKLPPPRTQPGAQAGHEGHGH